MATRRDQLQSYQFQSQRVISAFVLREADPPQSPLRRGIGALFAGLMLAVVVGAGYGVYGLLTKVGNDAWRAEGSVVIEKETGATFVFLGGRLHPALNYASALLAAGAPTPVVFRVAANSLAGTPRGTTVGIAGAPDSLPGPDRRVGLPWTVCAVPGEDAAGQPTRTVTLVVARAPTGDRPLGDDALLVADESTKAQYLIWHGRRHQIRQARIVVRALFGAATALPARTAWLNAIPGGADIAPITVDGRGDGSARVRDRRVGDLLSVQTGSGPQYYLVLDDGLAAITPLQQAILVAEHPERRPEPVELSRVTSAPVSKRLSRPSGDIPAPESPPKLASPAPGDLLCAEITDPAAVPAIRIGGSVPGLEAAAPTGSASPEGAPLADRVLVPPGHLAVIRVLSSPGARAGAYYLVTDLGIRYAVPSAAVLQTLGYRTDQAVDIPAGLVNRIPAGPALDPERAREAIAAGSLAGRPGSPSPG
jgi:type VII secretion protein EccB